MALGDPIGPPRPCPSCHELHPPGTTCRGGWAPWNGVEYEAPVDDRIIITLTLEEDAEAVQCGKDRLAKAKRGKRKDYLGEDSEASHVLGARGERAVYKWLGVPWECTMNRFSLPDVMGLQIRAVPRRGDDLKVRKSDGTKTPVVLVVVHEWERKAWIRGWIFAEEKKTLGVVRDPGDRGRPNYFVPPLNLRPMAELHRNDRARAQMGLPPLEFDRALPET